jgi:general secretion pathway protein A
VPRLINVIAERALLGGYAHDAIMLGEGDVDRAAREALAPARPGHRWRWVVAAASVVAAVALAVLWPRTQQAPAVARASAPVASVPAQAKPASAANVPRLDGNALSARIAAPAAASPQSWQALLSLWHADTDATAAMACPPAVASGLYCVRGRATLDKLAAQGRPAMLRLHGDGASAWALLLGADALRARLQLGGEVFDVERVVLQQAWGGEYAALWRGPEALATPPTADGRGPAVEWVHARLQPAYAGPAVLDAAMAEAVRGFQHGRGLAADGVVGPETLMALASGEPGPTLRTRLD